MYVLFRSFETEQYSPRFNHPVGTRSQPIGFWSNVFLQDQNLHKIVSVSVLLLPSPVKGNEAMLSAPGNMKSKGLSFVSYMFRLYTGYFLLPASSDLLSQPWLAPPPPPLSMSTQRKNWEICRPCGLATSYWHGKLSDSESSVLFSLSLSPPHCVSNAIAAFLTA